MKCTNCDKGFLKPNNINGLFPAQICDSCNGHWILIDDYANWKADNPDFDFSKQNSSDDFQINELTKALLCPISGSIMQKFRFIPTSEYKINYSAKAGGIWLNNGEWEFLIKEGLAGLLNTLLTEHKQNIIMQDKAKDHFSEFYRDKFGKENYQKLKEIRAWLDSNEQKLDLQAYLVADDPYKAR